MNDILDNWLTLSAALTANNYSVEELTGIIMREVKGRNRDHILARLRSRRRTQMRKEEEC